MSIYYMNGVGISYFLEKEYIIEFKGDSNNDVDLIKLCIDHGETLRRMFILLASHKNLMCIDYGVNELAYVKSTLDIRRYTCEPFTIDINPLKDTVIITFHRPNTKVISRYIQAVASTF